MTGAAAGADRYGRPGRTVLALDAVGEACEAALLRADGALFERSEPMARGHAERLYPLIDQVLFDAGVSAPQVELFAAARGPGSFTGVRIGVAAARGMALATGRRAVGVDGYAALAAAAWTAGVRSKSAAVVFGKPPRLVAQRFQLDDAGPSAFGPPGEFVAISDSAILLFGPAAEAGREFLARFDQAREVIEIDRRFDAIGAALTARLAAAGGPEVGPPAPIYLRPPDAEPSQERRPTRLGPRPSA